MEMLPLSDPLKSCVPQHLLRDWSPTNAQLALTGLIEGTPSAMAWEAIVEVLRFWPTPSRLPDACASVISPLQEWPWEWRAISYKRLRQLGLLDLIACTGSLRFEGFEYFGNEVLLLAESPASTSIRQLDFFKIEYTGGAFESLTRSPHLARLSVLRICNAPFLLRWRMSSAAPASRTSNRLCSRATKSTRKPSCWDCWTRRWCNDCGA